MSLGTINHLLEEEQLMKHPNVYIYIYIYHLFILLYSTMYVYKGFHVQTLQNNSAQQ